MEGSFARWNNSRVRSWLHTPAALRMRALLRNKLFL